MLLSNGIIRKKEKDYNYLGFNILYIGFTIGLSKIEWPDRLVHDAEVCTQGDKVKGALVQSSTLQGGK